MSPFGPDSAGLTNGAGLLCRVRHTAPIGLIEVVGVLRLDTMPQLRNAVLKVLSEGPGAIMLDLTETEVVEDAPDSVAFASLGQLVADHNAGELLLAVPSLRVRVVLQRRASLFVRVFATRAEAWLAARQGIVPRRMHRELLADQRAPVLARHMLRDLCMSWELSDELRERALVVVTELVTNAVEHAGAGIKLTITVRRRTLRLEVADDSEVLPRLLEPPAEALRGRGLLLVSRLASRWGSQVTIRGKVVWADLVIISRRRKERPLR